MPTAHGLTSALEPSTPRPEPLARPPAARRRCRELIEGQAERFFVRQPDSLAIVLQGQAPQAAPRRLHGIDVRQPSWWRRAGLPTARSGTPVLLLAEGLAADLEAAQAAALLWAVGECAPAGSLLLMDAPATAPAAHWLASPAALAALHPRLRCYDRHRLHEACGWAPRWAARLAELRWARPLWALYEVGVDV